MVSTYNYLRRLLDPKVFGELLKMENDQGLKPINHAANVAAFGMFTAILDTEGSVIVCPSVRLGLTMVKFSYSLVRHRKMAMYAVK